MIPKRIKTGEQLQDWAYGIGNRSDDAEALIGKSMEVLKPHLKDKSKAMEICSKYWDEMLKLIREAERG
jgi:hypothetical protein